MSFDDTPLLYCQVCDRLRTYDHFYAPHEHICDTCTPTLDPTSSPPEPSPQYLAKRAELDNWRVRQANLETELAQRVLARRRFMPFVKRFNGKYKDGWVHRDIARRLEKFKRDVELGLSPRLLLCMPPRGGKSELTSRKFPPWVLGDHPDWEIIAASHSQSLATSFSRHIRDLMRDPAYTAIFPGTALSPDSQAVENWNTTSEGGYLAAGVGTGITGRGANILIIDDPVKDIEAADSVTIRDNTWEWYMSTAYTRLAPGGGVLGILTLWNEDDWGGRIITNSENGEGDTFEIVRYPAINEGYDEYILEDGAIAKVYPGQPTPPPTAQLTRIAGSALHEERYDLATLQRIKKAYYSTGLQRLWHALYQQDPAPDEGLFFTKEMIQYCNWERKSTFNVYQAWDFAITEKKENDWIACTTIWQTEDDDLIIAKVRRFKSADGIAIVEAMIDEYEIHKPNFLGFEDGQIWKSIATLFTRRCQERRVYPNYDILVPLTDKLVRAGPLKGRMQMKKVYVLKDQPWTQAFVDELLKFPGGKHDDQCFVAGTRIRMADGLDKPIELVRSGEFVRTPFGPCRVVKSIRSGMQPVFSIAGLVGTQHHPIWVDGYGWKPLLKLRPSDGLQALESQMGIACRACTRKLRSMWRRLSSTVKNIVDTLSLPAPIFVGITPEQAEEGFFTGTSGHFITDKSLAGATSITSMISPILNASRLKNIERFAIKRKQLTDAPSSSVATLKLSDPSPRYGMLPLKVVRGIKRTARILIRLAKKHCVSVRSAAALLSLSSTMPNFVRVLAGTVLGTRLIRVMTQPSARGKQLVYNLEIENEHCYYANGILVHNCDSTAWCVRLTLQHSAQRRKTPPKTKSWRDKLPGLNSKDGLSHMAS